LCLKSLTISHILARKLALFTNSVARESTKNMKNAKQNTTKPDQSLIFATIGAAAGFCRVPVVVFRQLKKAGCAGFHSNGSVDLMAVFRWLLTKGQDFMPQMDLESARAQLAQARAAELTRLAQISAGTLVPPAQVVSVIALVLHWWESCIPQIAADLAHKINPASPWDICKALEMALQTAQINTVAAVLSREGAGLPQWAIEAIRRGLDEQPSKFDDRIELFRELMAASTPTIYGEELKRLRAERAPAEAQP
jgi:hypothetical protein